MYYHALATALLGDHGAIEKARRGYACWEDAYAAFGRRPGNAGTPLPAGMRPLPPHPERLAETTERAGIRIILKEDPLFPKQLREIPRPPHALYVKGNADTAGTDDRNGIGLLAIVGTRQATPEGKSLARRFGRTLSARGFGIVSGLAFGIDAAGHEGCLEGRGGPAIAVLAGGLGEVHPKGNRALAERIIRERGALISEYPPNEAPLPRRFIERNRIISGLSKGIVVVEAPERSGALATARFAFEQDRDLFVLPGNALAGHYRGSNLLIKQGAALVTSPEDILESYGIVIKKVGPAQDGYAEWKRCAGTLTGEESEVLDAIARECAAHGTAVDVDKISAAAKLEPRIVNRTLTFLVLKGLIQEDADGFSLNDHR